jgi:hypothetical protein
VLKGEIRALAIIGQNWPNILVKKKILIKFSPDELDHAAVPDEHGLDAADAPAVGLPVPVGVDVLPVSHDDHFDLLRENRKKT